MNYKDLIKSYHTKGFGTEKKMWDSIYVLEEAMMCLKEKEPEVYDEAMRDLHEIFCGAHYNECFAIEAVECMHHKDKKGEEIKGEHWSVNQVSGVIKGFNLPSTTTIWDVYVALNANWHDKEIKFNEWFGDNADRRIIEDAINFYFHDEDAEDGKIWHYMEAV